MKFHAVLLDETQCEFGVGIEAKDRNAAYEELAENYPESRVVQLESPKDTAEREKAMYRRIEREYEDPRWEDEY